MERRVGLVGVGIMGSAIAANLIKAGYHVVGFDVESARMQALAESGGVAASSPREVAQQADVVITLLPGVDILYEVATAADGLIAAKNRKLVVADCGTFDIPGKDRCRHALQAAGMEMLDCTISGTGSQAQTRDLVVYASGCENRYEGCVPIFSAFARASHYVGVFGNGSKVKYIANLLVAIHTAATAEAMVLAQRAGLDLKAIYELVKSSAATSRMFEVRGPSMVAGEYGRNVASKLELWQKDMFVIGDFAKALNCPVPLFAQSAQIYNAAIGQGHGKLDMAAICAVLECLAGIERSGTGGATLP
ncbi:MAG: 3-hydroxyisobutyrate dehydrogenase [Burkholderiales bacterium]|nr:3-hydroxyisobutyrate dehydrogenase [Burkholderiales bacterium]